MSNSVIKVESVSKQYQLGSLGTGTIQSDLKRWWASIRGKEDPTQLIGTENKINSQAKKKSTDYVWALRDISFEVEKGEVLGIIGKNGAGKSTLLKILSQVTTPTKGIIRAKGRIASLLEVGTGFHPELSGRDNIFLNGAILGMTKSEVKSKFDEIVSFSGVERYIDTPVKRYSSGMYVRLAFSVAAHLEPDILILDEVLAVGDAEFQKKCLGKMRDVSVNDGRTVLFVSHNMAAVKALCKKGIVLNNGLLSYCGTSENAIEHYLNSNQIADRNLNFESLSEAPGNDKIRIKSINVSPYKGTVLDIDSGVKFNIEYYNYVESANIDITLELLTIDDIMIFHNGCVLSNNKDSKKGLYSVEGYLPPFFLNTGAYKINLIFGESQRYLLCKIDDLISFEVENSPTGKGSNMNRLPGIISPNLNWNFNFID